MGTNYYFTKAEPEAKALHIGKSSSGWCFSLRVHRDAGINTLEDWKSVWATGSIKDEYGEPVTAAEMLSKITERSWKGPDEPMDPEMRSAFGSWLIFHHSNTGEVGPRGLTRHKLGGMVVGHGEGTWDYLEGDFS